MQNSGYQHLSLLCVTLPNISINLHQLRCFFRLPSFSEIGSMRVIVPSPQEDCVAHITLENEGIDHEVHRCEGPYGYGKLLAELWTKGQGFVIVEHDVAPWPGAITQLIRCDDIWCSHEYPLNFGLVYALGCTKFSEQLVASHPRITRDWATTHWGALDAKVVPALQTALDRTAHIHTPPVAHVRRY